MFALSKQKLFVLYFVALSFIIDARINAFTIRKSYNVTDGPPQDLAVGESLQLEVRHDLKRPNGIHGDVLNKSSESSTTNNINNAKGVDLVTPTFHQIATSTSLTEPSINVDVIEKGSANDESKELPKITHAPEPFTTQPLKISSNNVSNENGNLSLIQQINDLDNSMTVSVPEIKDRTVSSRKSTTDKKVAITDDKIGLNKETTEQGNVPYTTNKYFTVPEGTEFTTILVNNNFSKARLPQWKKYTVIDRKRVPTNVVSIEPTGTYTETVTETVQDSFTSDSLTSERKAGDLHLTILDTSTSDSALSTPNYKDITDTQNLIISTKSEELRPEILTLETVFSKRAGFLNLSSKSKETDATAASYTFDTMTGSDTLSKLETSIDEHRKSTFADGSESQRHLEDAVKEVLLQETSLRNNEEITTQNLDEELNMSTTSATAERSNTGVTNQETTDVTDTDSTPYNNSSKVKSTKMYAVNPNYKPMKKIEVQPPKTFVRDPDDNSWRNESISSLGIVFKPKNSSKPFTQVLKNKTETEWSNLLNKDSKNDVPDLRERLEKIAQRRKTKKKKTDAFGNIIYSDYEESNSSEEIINTERHDITPTSIATEETTTYSEIALSTIPILTTQTPNTVTTSESITSTHSEEIGTTTSIPGSDTDITTILTYIPLTEVKTTPTTSEIDSPTTFYTTLLTTKVTTSSSNLNTTQSSLPKHVIKGPSTEKQKKIFQVFEYYDGSDEDDREYLELAKLELKKKNTDPIRVTNKLFTTLPPQPYRFTSLPPYLPERKGTIQYFPPRSTKPPKHNRFDSDFDKEFKYNTRKSSSKNFVPITYPPDIRPPPIYVINSPLPDLSQTQHYHNLGQSTIKPDGGLLPPQLPTMYKSNEYTRNLYQSTPLAITSVPNNAQKVADPNKGFNRATYVVKNYKDILEQAAKDYDYERDSEYLRYTESPIRGITLSDLVTQEKDRHKTNFNYDYDVKFRKDVLQRFVDNFNHNDARYNDDFPVLYNNSVMHVNLAGNGEAVASSRAFLKGLYNPSDTKLGYARREPYDVNCDKCTVELSPAYELHYYVPDQEEKEEAEPKPTGISLP